jgi:MerR family transcriptional regulator, thiopeptide resistance regulator
MDDTVSHSVGDVARMSGVTVRALHHYDEIGLLHPSHRTPSGYRQYTPQDVERLARILVYRSCGLSLPEIASVMAASGTDRMEHLRRQLELLDATAERLQQQRQLLITAWEAQQMGITLGPDEYFEVFGESDPRQYADEAQERWGETDAYRESSRRTSEYTKDDWQRLGEESARIETELAACLREGEPADGPRATAAAEAHRQHIDRWFYPCSYDMHVGLADMYVADPRFAAHYDEIEAGLAAYVHEAILANALGRIA